MDQLTSHISVGLDTDQRIATPTDREVATVRAEARDVMASSVSLPAVSTDTMRLVKTQRAAVQETLGNRWDVIKNAVEKAMKCSELAERLLNMKAYIQILVEGRDVEIFRLEKGYVITVSNGVEESTYHIDADGQLTTFSTNFYRGATGEGTIVPVLFAGPQLNYELSTALKNNPN